MIRERALDVALSALGLSTALGSAAFAGYMVVVGPGDGGARQAAPLMAAVPPPAHAPHVTTPPDIVAAAGPGRIDFDPTGSIPAMGDAADGADASPDPMAVLSDFAVRDVFDGTALVEAHGTLRMVVPGSTIDGAGKVLAVERIGSTWTVKTDGGVIRQRR